MSPFDSYFTSGYEDERKKSHAWNPRFNHHWKTFQRLSYDQQSQRIDEILFKQKIKKLTHAELAVLLRWEKKSDPMRRL